MCGIAVFNGNKGKSIDLVNFSHLMLVNEKLRGGHAFGWTWIDRFGVLRCYKRPGMFDDHIEDANMLEGAVQVVGHVRWATHGKPDLNENNHPHHADGGWYVVNGVLDGYDLMSWGVPLNSSCDSELIGRYIEDASGSLAERVGKACRRSEGLIAFAGLWKSGLVLWRDGKPLHQMREAEGSYFSSIPLGNKHSEVSHKRALLFQRR